MIYLPYECVTSQKEEQLSASGRWREPYPGYKRTIPRITGTRTPIAQFGMTGGE